MGTKPPVDTVNRALRGELALMQSPTRLLRAAGAILAVALLSVGSACTDNNSGSNAPANSTYGTGQHLAHPPSAGVGPQNAGPAGSQ